MEKKGREEGRKEGAEERGRREGGREERKSKLQKLRVSSNMMTLMCWCSSRFGCFYFFWQNQQSLLHLPYSWEPYKGWDVKTWKRMLIKCSLWPCILYIRKQFSTSISFLRSSLTVKCQLEDRLLVVSLWLHSQEPLFYSIEFYSILWGSRAIWISGWIFSPRNCMSWKCWEKIKLSAFIPIFEKITELSDPSFKLNCNDLEGSFFLVR